jgi:hypothetical protein
MEQHSTMTQYGSLPLAVLTQVGLAPVAGAPAGFQFYAIGSSMSRALIYRVGFSLAARALKWGSPYLILAFSFSRRSLVKNLLPLPP